MLRNLSLCCVVALMIGMVGCKKADKKEPLPSDAQQAVDQAVKENAPPVPSGATAAAAPSTSKMDCEKLLPQALRDKFFSGLSMKQEAMCPGCPDQCRFSKDEADKIGPVVLADCRWNDRPNWFEESSKVMAGQKSWKKIDGLGRLAFTAMNMQVIFIPEKYNCVVTVTWFGGESKLIPLGTEIEAGLTPAALGM